MSSPRRTAPRIAVLPPGDNALVKAAVAAVEGAGGVVVDPADAEALVWTSAGMDPETTAAALQDELGRHPGIRWVQLPWAGVELYAEAGLLDHEHVWTCAKGVYGKPVAEHALTLTLACFRHLKEFGRAEHWSAQAGQTLFGRRVTIFGGGGIAQELLRLLNPFGCQATVVRKRPDPLQGARILGWERRNDALGDADAVILALALTDENAYFFAAPQLEAMAPHACLVNVARGRHVVTDDLVDALAHGGIGAAGLDVTDPEPLPDGHPLWALDNCLITPHTANTEAMAIPALAARIADNVRRFGAGEPLEGLVDPDLGY
jgi:phosphoglycerate dehydrogenase-like enzyme